MLDEETRSTIKFTHKFPKFRFLWRLKVFGKILVLVEIAKEVDSKDVRLVQLVAVAGLHSICCLLWLLKFKEKVPAIQCQQC